MNIFTKVHAWPHRAAVMVATLSGAAAIVAGAALPAAADAPAGNHVYQVYTSTGLLMDLTGWSGDAKQDSFTVPRPRTGPFVPVPGQSNVYQIENYANRNCLYFDQSTLYPTYGAVIEGTCSSLSSDEWFFVAATPGSPYTTYSIQSVAAPTFAITYFPSLGSGAYLQAQVLDGAGADQSFSLFDLAG